MDHLLLIGPPGTGKTMLARRLAREFPIPPSDTHAARRYINQVSGLDRSIDDPPFRAPHHSCSLAALTGNIRDGWRWHPGEFTLAHGGTLFLDEAAEFHPRVFGVLEQALKRGTVTLIGAERAPRFYPAAFRLIAATQPCPCGWHGVDPTTRRPAAVRARWRKCECVPAAIERYQARIPAAIRERCRTMLVGEYLAELDRLLEEERSQPPKVQRLIADAAEALDHFTEDELEDAARR